VCVCVCVCVWVSVSHNHVLLQPCGANVHECNDS